MKSLTSYRLCWACALTLLLALMWIAAPKAEAQFGMTYQGAAAKQGAKKKRAAQKNKKMESACQKEISTGMAGTISYLQGNFMPSPDGPSGGSTTQVQRTLYVYPLQKTGEGSSGAFQAWPKDKPTACGTSCTDGTYKLKLKPGKYSVYVLEENKLFANGFDGDGYIQPVEIKQGEVTQLNISINHKAAY